MFHANTELLLDYWRAKRRAAVVMRRSALDPVDLAPLLSRILIAGRSAAGDLRLRLAGECVVRAHDGARVGDDLLAFWREADRAPLRRALEAAMRCGEPLVVLAEAALEAGGEAPLEISFIPLAAAGPQADRVLGFYQPISIARWRRLAGPLAVIELIATGGAPALRLAAVDGRRIA